jgi:hypothetical protein
MCEGLEKVEGRTGQFGVPDVATLTFCCTRLVAFNIILYFVFSHIDMVLLLNQECCFLLVRQKDSLTLIFVLTPHPCLLYYHVNCLW